MKIFLSEKKKKKKTNILCCKRKKKGKKSDFLIIQRTVGNLVTYSVPMTHDLWFGDTVQSCFLCVQVRFQKENVRKRWNFWRIKLCFWAEINHCHCPVMIFQSANQIQFISWTIDGLRWTWTEINLSHFSYSFLAKMSAHSFPFHILWTTLCLDFHTLRLVIFHRWDMS